MPYELVVDQERQLLWVRYSGVVTIAERRAVAETALASGASHGMRRFLLDFRRASTSSTDEASAEALAEYMAGAVRGRHLRAAWLVTYDHQLDAAVETKAHEVGVEIRRFREFDAAVAWLQRPEPAARPQASEDARESEPHGTPLAMHIALGSSHPARRAHGTFAVKVVPQSPDNPPAQAAALARLSLDKRYEGPLDAVGQGEMLADGGADRKDGAYVALERVTGTLHGRAGSFALVHRALMRDGTPEDWSVVVVPGSGTGELERLEGSLRISVEQGKHFYDFEYTLPG
jgi:hypothetical protein